MVRRGSTVRVRQRAFPFLLLSGFFVVSLGGRELVRRPPGVHRVDVRGIKASIVVEELDRVLSSVSREVAVVAVNLARLVPM